MKTMLNIIDDDRKLSLRTLDWFVTNYSKKNDTYYKLITLNDMEKKFCVHVQYKNELNMYTKDYFDPFCRKKGTKIKCYYDKDDLKVKFETSVAQLNFMKWAIKNKVIKYSLKHVESIKNDQKQTLKFIKDQKLIPEKIKHTSSIIDDNDEFGMNNTDHLKLSLVEKTQKKRKRQLLCSPKNVMQFNSNQGFKFTFDD